jgi:hypothetical protein
MGLVLALRFLCWGALAGAVSSLLFFEAVRQPSLLRLVALPTLFAFYLLACGQILLLIRLQDAAGRLLALGPLLSLGLLALPGVRQSPALICVSLILGLELYLSALARQAGQLEHGRAVSWFGRLRLLAGALALPALIPGVAAPLTLVAGPIVLGALLVGWRVWLMELRQGIAEREEV